VETPGIVNGFDVAEHTQSGVFQTREQFVVGAIVFEGREEAFHDGAFVAASGTRHGAFDGNHVSFRRCLKGLATVVSIGVSMSPKLTTSMMIRESTRLVFVVPVFRSLFE